jgi:gag-polypeptide of LTR copia-type
MVCEFMTAKMDDSIDMEHHTQRIKRLKQQIEEQGERISDTIYNSILLNSLPDDYKIVISILKSTSDLTPIMIINRILEENHKIYGAGGEGAKVELASKALGKAKAKTKARGT